MRKYTIALMCAEREPLDCHRTILVSRQLVADGLDIRHIHDDGHLETHDDAMVRLAQILKLRESEYHLFRSREDLLTDAYAIQEKRIGYDSSSEARELESASG